MIKYKYLLIMICEFLVKSDNLIELSYPSDDIMFNLI